MRHKPQSCQSCAICDHGSDFSSIEGTGSSGVMLVGEASGQHEQRDQLPFRPFAPAGGVLERCLRRMGLDRRQFSITNVVRCRPRHDFLDGAPWEYSAISSCRPNLDSAIAERKPRAIVALGGIPTRELTGEAGEARGVTHLAGYVLPLASMRVPCDFCISYDSLSVPRAQRMTDASCDQCHGSGYVSDQGNIPVVVNFHPSYLRRGKASHQGVWSRILHRGMQIARGMDKEWMWGVDPEEPATWGTPDGGRLQYFTKPTLDQCWSIYHYLRDNQGLTLAKDLETFESASLDEDARDGFQDTQIRTYQLSYQVGTGVSIPYVNGFREIVHRLETLKNKFYGHNWNNFDHKVMKACSQREGWEYKPSDWCYDTLDMFHHWQPDLPAHLQFCCEFIRFPFPWKHLSGTNIEFYGICDVDADLRLGMWLEGMLMKDGIWGKGDAYDITCGYTGQVREVRPVLAAMEDRGVPVDNDRRMALGAEFDAAQEELGVALLARFPEEAKKPEWYKTTPPEIRKLGEGEDPARLFKEEDRWRCRCKTEKSWQREKCEKCGQLREDGRIKPGKWYHYAQREHEGGLRWCYIPEFNPNSKDQLVAYMKSKGHPVPKSKEEDDAGNQKDTTAAKELQRLAVKTGDDFYLKVVEFRGYSKMKGTYVEGFKPNSEGYVHTTFTFDTGIGQLSSRNPNAQNFPKLKPTPTLAKAMRGIIRAKRGRVITEWDYKSCHALTLGYLAESPNYMRMARLDIHSFVAGHFLQLWNAHEIVRESDEELKKRFKWLKTNKEWKQVRDDQAKHCIAHGELVLTDVGPIPIQNISLAHRVWDGVEWVSHDGLVDQGIMEVITHDGLTATPNQRIYTDRGEEMLFGEAASEEVRLSRAGIGGDEVWLTRDHVPRDSSAGSQASNGSSQMPRDGNREVDVAGRAPKGQDHLLYTQRSENTEAFMGLGEEIRRHYIQMQESKQPSLLPLWWKRDPVQFRESDGVRPVGVGEPSSRELSRSRNRSKRQQWALRAWELETSQQKTAAIKQAEYGQDAVPGRDNCDGGVRQPLRSQLDSQVSVKGDDGRRDNRTREEARIQGQGQDVAHATRVVRVARVYDILNAGPRNRFTVSGRLVHNSILGIGNGLRYRGLFERYMENFPPRRCPECTGSGKVNGLRGLKLCPQCKGSTKQGGLAIAKEFEDITRDLWPEVFAWQGRMQDKSHREQFLRTEFGHIRRFYEVFRWDGKKSSWGHGDQAEEAIAFWLANIAFGHIREGLKNLDRCGAAEKYRLFNNVHDSYMFECPEELVEEHRHVVAEVLLRPSEVLTNPKVAPGGLVIDIEAGIGEDWAHMEELVVPRPEKKELAHGMA